MSVANLFLSKLLSMSCCRKLSNNHLKLSLYIFSISLSVYSGSNSGNCIIKVSDWTSFSSVDIGEESFIGAGAVVLPGTKTGKYSIVGAGAVVKGCFAAYSVIVGTPAKRIKDIRE